MSNQPSELKAPIAHLVCDPCSEALDFYSKAFNAEEMLRIPAPDGDKIMHACMKLDQGYIFLVDDFPEFSKDGKSSSPKALGGTSVTINRYVDNCDQSFNKAIDAGATSVMEPEDAFWGDRYAVVTDPFGHKWSLAHHVRDVSENDLQAAMKEAFTGEKC